VIDDGFGNVLVQDAWDVLDEDVREEFLTRRAGLSDPASFGRPHTDRRWAPLRPVVLDQRAYQRLGSIVARVLALAVESCRRRATTLGELHKALGYADELPLMDPDGPLVAAELTRCARPDILIENGQPRIVELNVGARLGGGTLAPRMARGYAQLVPRAALRTPRCTVTSRSEAMIRALGRRVGDTAGPGGPTRLAAPRYWTLDDSGERHHNRTAKKRVLADARRVGFEVVQPDLDQLRLDDSGRLTTAGEPIDLVLIPWGSGEPTHMVEHRAGLAALRDADHAGTVTLFPRTESALLNSKAVLAWLHEDRAAGLLDPADDALVRDHVPETALLDPDATPELSTASLPSGGGASPDGDRRRDQVVMKPALGKAGNGVLFGSQSSDQSWRRAALDGHARATVLQQRVTPDQVTMTFFDQTSGGQHSAEVPFLLSPFMIDGAIADISVRHMTPDVPDHDVVIAVDLGGCWNTVLLLPEEPGAAPSGD
jgi:hypothetical protein